VLEGFHFVTIGAAVTHKGNAVTAVGTATIGAGGITYAGGDGILRIGDALGVPVNLAITGPGATATGSATVAGDIAGYETIIIGRVVATGTASGSLDVTGGTVTTTSLSVGTVSRQVAGGGATGVATDATGGLSVTDGAIVIVPPFPVPGSAGLTRIGHVSAVDASVADQASGALTLTRSSFTGGALEIGTVSGGVIGAANGSVAAVEGSGIDVASLLMGFRGTGTMVLTDSTLRVRADPALGFSAFVAVGSNGGSGEILAIGSDVTIDRSLQVGANTFQNVPSLSRVSLAGGSTLSVGEFVSLGDFWPGSRAELLLSDSSATVGGSVFLGAAANNGTLFGEALLSVDASFLDIEGALLMSVGAETLLGIGGTHRGLGGYGAIDALEARLAGLVTVDFAGLVGFDLDSFDFDLISVLAGFTDDFGTTQFLNLPDGYAVTFYGIMVEGEGDVWRVTLARVSVAEPGALALLLAGLAGLTLTMRRRAA
jgi:hypothetical protein